MWEKYNRDYCVCKHLQPSVLRVFVRSLAILRTSPGSGWRAKHIECAIFSATNTLQRRLRDNCQTFISGAELFCSKQLFNCFSVKYNLYLHKSWQCIKAKVRQKVSWLTANTQAHFSIPLLMLSGAKFKIFAQVIG